MKRSLLILAMLASAAACETDPRATTGTGANPTASATLATLTVSAGTLAPAFASATTSYTLSVPAGTSSLSITPATSAANSTVSVSGSAVASGGSIVVPIAVGTTTIPVVVTSSDGTSSTAYTLTVTRVS